MPVFIRFFIIAWSILCVSVASVKADPLQVDSIYNKGLAVDWTNSKISGGKLKWEDAQQWIKGLNKDKFGGYSDWRLPDTLDGTWEYDGGNGGKYNVDVSELGYFYYRILKLSSRQNKNPNSTEILKNAVFDSLLPDLYWFGPLSKTRLNISAQKPNGDSAAWVFDFGFGSQFLQTTNMTAYAIAVRSVAPVPEPSSAVLFLTGLFVVSRIQFRSNH